MFGMKNQKNVTPTFSKLKINSKLQVNLSQLSSQDVAVRTN